MNSIIKHTHTLQGKPSKSVYITQGTMYGVHFVFG